MTQGMTYILKNGRVVDPANGRDGIFDIEVRDGVIARVGANLEWRQGPPCWRSRPTASSRRPHRHARASA